MRLSGTTGGRWNGYSSRRGSDLIMAPNLGPFPCPGGLGRLQPADLTGQAAELPPYSPMAFTITRLRRWPSNSA
jgi:hypothetical protein